MMGFGFASNGDPVVTKSEKAEPVAAVAFDGILTFTLFLLFLIRL